MSDEQSSDFSPEVIQHHEARRHLGPNGLPYPGEIQRTPMRDHTLVAILVSGSIHYYVYTNLDGSRVEVDAAYITALTGMRR